MKNTFLVFNDKTNPTSGLHVATPQEWNQILKRNKTLPRDQRRFFIKDAFEDFGEIDCMYIETTREEYNKWHSEKVYSERKRGYGTQYEMISMHTELPEQNELTYEDIIADGFNLEETVLEGAKIEVLKNKLAQWKTWGAEMLELYLAGKKEQATFIISEEYGVSTRQVQRWKMLFERYVKRFFEKY